MKNDIKQIQFIEEYKDLLEKYYNSIATDKKNKGKLKGAIVANLIKKYIQDIIAENGLPFKVSDNNVYVENYAVECDLLILKQDCEYVFNAPPIYPAKGVQAIIECKATGIFPDSKNPKNPFIKELKMLEELNQKGFSVKFGYISLAEQIGSGRLLNEANNYINEYVDDSNKNKGVFCFAKTYPENQYPVYEGNEYCFIDYVKALCTS